MGVIGYELYGSPRAAVCDIERGIENMGDNPILFRKHLGKFQGKGYEMLSQLLEYIEQDNYESASMLCHSIKGLAGMLALPSLHADANLAEKLLMQAMNSDRPENNLRDINRMTDCLREDIDAICKIRL